MIHFLPFTEVLRITFLFDEWFKSFLYLNQHRGLLLLLLANNRIYEMENQMSAKIKFQQKLTSNVKDSLITTKNCISSIMCGKKDQHYDFDNWNLEFGNFPYK